MLIRFAFFSSYFIFALLAGKLVGWRYKQTMVIGLIVMAVGALLPASTLASFDLFLSTLVILAAGITCLQVSANPYVTSLGHCHLRTNAQTKIATAPLSQNESWMNTSLDPDTRADLMIREITLDEKIQLVHGADGVGYVLSGASLPPGHNPAPATSQVSHACIFRTSISPTLGARMGPLQSRYSTLLPSVLGMAVSWDTSTAYLYGSVIGRELRDQG